MAPTNPYLAPGMIARPAARATPAAPNPYAAPGMETNAGEPQNSGNGSFIGNLWRSLLQGGESFFGGLEKANQADAAANRGKTLAQRALDPQGIATAADIALATSPANIGEGTAFGAIRKPMPPRAAEGRLADFDKTGVAPDVATIGQGHSAKLANKLNRALPGSPVQKGIRQRLAQTATASERIAGRYGSAETPEVAGKMVKGKLHDFSEDNKEVEEDRAKLTALMHGAPPIPMTKPLALLQEFKGTFPRAQSIINMFEEKLRPKTETIPAKFSPVLDESGNPIQTEAEKTIQSGGELPLKKALEGRTFVGYHLTHPSFGPDTIPYSQLQRLYGAITEEIRAAAARRGPAALQAFERSNFMYQQKMQIIKRVLPLVQPKSGDGVFAAINAAAQREGSRGADIDLLTTAKHIMGKDWGNVGAAMIRRFGEPLPGAPRVGGEPEFSVSSWATNWNRLSARAKDAIFGDDVPGSNRAALESLARVVNAQRSVAHLAGQSPTGEANALFRAFEGMVTMMAGQRFPYETATAIGAAYGLGKLMMSPKFTRWWTKLPRMLHEGMVPQKAAQLLLRSAAGASEDGEQPQPSKASKAPASKIGDKGPAGGTITGKGADAL